MDHAPAGSGADRLWSQFGIPGAEKEHSEPGAEVHSLIINFKRVGSAGFCDYRYLQWPGVD